MPAAARSVSSEPASARHTDALNEMLQNCVEFIVRPSDPPPGRACFLEVGKVNLSNTARLPPAPLGEGLGEGGNGSDVNQKNWPDCFRPPARPPACSKAEILLL